MSNRESDTRAIGYGAMLMEGLVGITALLAAVALPPSDYFAINTDPKVAVVAPAAGGPGVVRGEGDLVALDAALTADDRHKLGLAPGASASSLAGQTLKVSQVLRLSNGALAAVGFHADAHAAPRVTGGQVIRTSCLCKRFRRQRAESPVSCAPPP